VPAACGGGQENPSARGQKISSPKTLPFFARSPFGQFFGRTKNKVLKAIFHLTLIYP